MNMELIKDFSGEEILTAIKQMHPTKAPGLNGMSAIFFQKCWSIVGNDVTRMVLNVLNNNMSLAKLNKTNITLIPKSKLPTTMTEFRPIILSNVVYKIIAKVLTNRLKAILPNIISKNQSAFFPSD